MKFLDLFAGIGGFRLGMESAGHKCIGFCEIDKFARVSYKAIHDTKGEIELHDITRVTDESIRRFGSVDVICGGFPCQAFSIAGNRRGFEDTRGTLFFEIARFASILRPRYLFLENVRGLLNHENGITFATIISTLDELGYDVEWQVLNSKDFGVPQNRERVFIIGHLRGERTRRIFPLGGESQSTSSQSVVKIGNVNPSGIGMNGEVYQADDLAPTLTTNLENVKQWFIDRDLENGGRLDKQSLKLSEEFGELCAGYLKKNEKLTKDSIGDCAVVIVGLALLIKEDVNQIFEESDKIRKKDVLACFNLLNANISEFQLSQNLASKEMCRHNLVRCIGYLKNFGYDFDECFELAYQEIKDRKGRWIDGSFVKKEDLR